MTASKDPASKNSSSKTPAPKTPADEPARGERLQKVLAAAGIASRRQCEQMILEGRVDVDRQVVNVLGTRVDPSSQEIRVDGVALTRPRLHYFILNKPQGVVNTAHDPWGRTRDIDLLPENAGRVFPVGRLDMSSEGLVLLTNDGELANRLAHPRYGIEKTYMVQVAGELPEEVVGRLHTGIWIAEGRVKVERASIFRRYKQSTILHIVLREGKNREIRRILARLGHKVQRLRRIAIGPLSLGDLPLGEYRPLRNDEVKRLKEASLRGPAPRKAKPSHGKPRGKRPPAPAGGPGSSADEPILFTESGGTVISMASEPAATPSSRERRPIQGARPPAKFGGVRSGGVRPGGVKAGRPKPAGTKFGSSKPGGGKFAGGKSGGGKTGSGKAGGRGPQGSKGQGGKARGGAGQGSKGYGSKGYGGKSQGGKGKGGSGQDRGQGRGRPR